MTCFLVNQRRRSVKCPGLFGARVMGGTLRHEATGVGDSVFIDLHNGFFTIADSSDRNPVFGRKFLQCFSAFLAGFKLFSPETIHTDETIELLKESIIHKSESVLASLPFHGSCAFTGISLLRTDRGRGALLFHSGDTLLFLSSPGQRTRRITKNNFWLIGKSSKLFQVEYLKIESGMRFFFATDGLPYRSFLSGKERAAMIEEHLQTTPIENIPDILFDCFDTAKQGRDDIAVLALDPGGYMPDVKPILLGGTTAEQEQKRRLDEKVMRDQYEPWNPDVQSDFYSF